MGRTVGGQRRRRLRRPGGVLGDIARHRAFAEPVGASVEQGGGCRAGHPRPGSTGRDRWQETAVQRLAPQQAPPEPAGGGRPSPVVGGPSRPSRRMMVWKARPRRTPQPLRRQSLRQEPGHARRRTRRPIVHRRKITANRESRSCSAATQSGSHRGRGEEWAVGRTDPRPAARRPSSLTSDAHGSSARCTHSRQARSAVGENGIDQPHTDNGYTDSPHKLIFVSSGTACCTACRPAPDSPSR